MRKTYVYDKHRKKLVEKGEEVRAKAHHIMPDIKPYQVVGPEYGKWISSRSRHREYLKKHGLIELGSEKPKFRKRNAYRRITPRV